MNDRGWQWAESLGHWALAWTFVVIAVCVWIGLGHPRKAALRYWGWLWATFAGMALAPLIAGIVPCVSWRDAVGLTETRVAPVPAAPDRFHSWFEGQAVTGRHDRDSDQGQTIARPQRLVRPAPPAQASGLRPRSAWDQDNRGRTIALVVWALGFSAFAIRLAWAVVRVRALLAGGTSGVPPDLLAELAWARAALGLRRRVRLRVHPAILAPVCLGLFRPTVLWPTEVNCPMTPAQRRASLIHELAHLQHLDDWVSLLAEVWRALCWFYLPVHWTLARLQREREFRCDDVASSQSESPETYARWLLDLAPIRVQTPLLASSLLGGADLASRVRRLFDGAARDARPLSRRQTFLMAVLAIAVLAAAGSVRLVGLAARAAEDEPADATLPEITAKLLAERIQAAWKGYDAGLLEVAFDEERPADRRSNLERVEAPNLAALKFPGRFQYVGAGRRWRFEFDSMMPNSNRQLRPDRWATGFDGSRHYIWDARSNEITFGEFKNSASPMTPRELFWPQSKSLLDMLAARETKIGQRTAGGVRCYVVERTNGDWRTEYLVSPRQEFLVVESTLSYRGITYSSHRLREFQRSEGGAWAPREITEELLDIAKSDGAAHLINRRVLRVIRFEPGRTFAKDDFAFKIPLNADITDRTLGTSFCNDPWWPELGKLLRDRFDWPKPNLWPLRELQSDSGEATTGKEALPIQASLWVHSGPVDLATLRGKVVLIHFTALGGGYDEEPALKRLAEHYKPAGLEVVTLLPSYDDPDEARQWVRELEFANAVAIDGASEKGHGATRDAFEIDGYASTILVDHLGKVQRFGRGELIDTLVRLLREGGAQGVEPLSLEIPRLTRTMTTAVDRAWRELMAQAPTVGKIVGTIQDAQGRPIAGAQVRATVNARLLDGPSAHFVFYARNHSSAISEADGSFLISGLCKGNYRLRVSSPGLAPVEREALIGPDLGEATIKVTLAQGDNISGRVVDESGQPLAAVDVSLSERRLPHPDGTETSFPGVLEMKITDREGRFRFSRLEEGNYKLRVAADGFEPQTHENMTAGSNALELTLRRPKVP